MTGNLLYAQSGGVTAVNNLHGSANAIGGQSQTNKLRWGCAHPDDMPKPAGSAAERDDAGALHRISQSGPNAGWGSWIKMGGEMAGGASAARNEDGRLEVFVRATDGSVQHAWESAPHKW